MDHAKKLIILIILSFERRTFSKVCTYLVFSIQRPKKMWRKRSRQCKDVLTFFNFVHFLCVSSFHLYNLHIYSFLLIANQHLYYPDLCSEHFSTLPRSGRKEANKKMRLHRVSAMFYDNYVWYFTNYVNLVCVRAVSAKCEPLSRAFFFLFGNRK